MPLTQDTGLRCKGHNDYSLARTALVLWSSLRSHHQGNNDYSLLLAQRWCYGARCARTKGIMTLVLHKYGGALSLHMVHREVP
jgi:hypothetical protein